MTTDDRPFTVDQLELAMREHRSPIYADAELLRTAIYQDSRPASGETVLRYGVAWRLEEHEADDAGEWWKLTLLP